MLALILVESKNSQNDSDYKYIKSTLEYYYDTGNKVKLKPVYLNGKSNYNKVENKIRKIIADYALFPENKGKVEVFLCLDTDDLNAGESLTYNVELNRKIETYCNEKGYNLIWFSREIEEVYIGNRLKKSQEKTARADTFIRRNEIEAVNELSLTAKISEAGELRKGKSNILDVFDHHFIRRS